MSVTNYWKNYYLNTDGKLKRRKKTFVPKYLNKRSNSFAFGHHTVDTPTASARPRGVFQGWNRSAYFRFKANRDSFSSRSVPNSTPSSAIIKPLKPRLNLARRKSTISKNRNLQPVDILEKFKHLIDGKVVILTPNLVVTRTSPTPEEISPTADSVPSLDTKQAKTHAKSGKVDY